MSSFLTEYKHIFVAVNFVCVMVLLYYLVYKPSMLSQSVKSATLVKSVAPGGKAISTLGGGCGKQLNSKQLNSKQLNSKQLKNKQSSHAYSDSDYE